MQTFRHSKRFPCFLFVAVASLLLASPANAQRSCESEPGSGAVDQYCEAIPSPGGDRGPGDPFTGGSAGSAGPGGGGLASVPGGLPAFLFGAGADGGTGGGASATGGSAELLGGGGGDDEAASAGASSQDGAPSNNPLGAIRSAVEGGSTTGSGLIWVLIGLGLLLAGVAWLRYRSIRTDSSG